MSATPKGALLLAIGLLLSHQALAQDIPWATLDFDAHKLVVDVKPTISLSVLTDAELTSSLQKGPACAAATPPNALSMSSTSTLFGKTLGSDLIFLPSSGDLVLLVESETGSNWHQRTSRRCAGEILQELRRPADATEQSGDPTGWTDVQTSTAKLADAQQVVLGPSAVLWKVAEMVSSSQTAADVSVLAHDQVEQVNLTGTSSQTSTTYQWSDSSGSKSVSPARVIDISLTVASTNSGTSQFQLMGLDGDATISVDVARRVPVEINGTVSKFGAIKVKLVSATAAAP